MRPASRGWLDEGRGELMRARGGEATLILVRHGETEWNLSGRIQGHLDSPLTALGSEQGRRVTERLSGFKIGAVYASDVGRATVTAELIATPHGLTVTQVGALRERCYGDFEGRTLQELSQHDAATVKTWLADRQQLAPPHGETQPQMAERVVTALREIAGKHLGEMVAVATHGGPIKSAVFSILQAPLSAWDRTWVSNGSITILRGKPELLRVACYNDTCHLDSTFVRAKGIED